MVRFIEQLFATLGSWVMTEKAPRMARWECPNCGQSYFGDDPPDMCDFCGDFTTWRPLTDLLQGVPRPRPPRRRDEDSSNQLPLFD